MRTPAPALLTLLALAGPLQAQARPRARELGLRIGRLTPGPLDALTDVKGVRVGHTTLNRGEGALGPGRGPVRTGVTAILPHGGDLWHDKVPAAAYVLNGNGEVTGLHWVNEQGALEVPILLTNTMNVPRVADAVLTWMMRKYPAIGLTEDVVLPVVGECDDSVLNDARGRHVTEGDVLAALDGAAEGPVAEGCVGAGTGMISYQFKGGIGTASRLVKVRGAGTYTVGALVNANHGRRPELLVAGVPVGRELPKAQVAPGAHSIVMVLATDAPLDARQLGRLAKRAALGLARTGSSAHHSSGDFVVAFSTAGRITEAAPLITTPRLTDEAMDPLFEGAAEAVEAAVIHALLAATTTSGREGAVAEALPLDKLRAVMAAHGRPLAPAK
ncbi:MAG TPA: P1 family peptidase [Holophagaceae bacterium]|nr:P1 family peptidase [Holophagaceae bacterium]